MAPFEEADYDDDPFLYAPIHQQFKIGIIQFGLGYISPLWAKAYTKLAHYNKVQPIRNWETSLIRGIHTYLITLWTHRNQQLHDLDTENSNIKTLHDKISRVYNQHQYIIPAKFTYLYNQKLPQLLQLPFQSLQLWLKMLHNAMKQDQTNSTQPCITSFFTHNR